MADLVPMSWKSSLERLRENINHAFEKYLSRLKRTELSEDDFSLPDWLDSFGYGIELDENAMADKIGHDWKNREEYDKDDGSVVDW